MISLLSDDGQKRKGTIMRKILLAFGLCVALLSSAAMAQSTKGLMFGGTVGFAKPHGSDNSSGTTIGARVGQSIQPNVSWEADVNLGVSDGEIGTDHSWSINSGAVYGVFRTD